MYVDVFPFFPLISILAPNKSLPTHVKSLFSFSFYPMKNTIARRIIEDFELYFTLKYKEDNTKGKNVKREHQWDQSS